MAQEEDTPTLGYAHGWNPSSELSLDQFLQKNKPAALRNDGKNSKPFIWVLKSDSMEGEDHSKAIEEAKVIINDTVQKVSEVQANHEIPVRANKKKGLKSKKEVREEIQSKATEDLKAIALKHGFVAGKWLAFAPEPQVDSIFAKLAHSLVSGELSNSSASQVRVTTRPATDPENGSHQHNLSIYFPNVYDEDMARDVMKVLLRHHGLKIAGAKANLYTALGLDSKHASGIPSTVWKGSGGGLMSEAAIQALHNAYFEEQGQSNGADNEAIEATQKKTKNVSKRQTRVDDSNPFASDEDNEEDDTKGATKETTSAAGKATTKVASKKRPISDSDDDEGQSAPPKKAIKSSASTRAVRGTGPRPKVHVGKKKQQDSDSE